MNRASVVPLPCASIGEKSPHQGSLSAGPIAEEDLSGKRILGGGNVGCSRLMAVYAIGQSAIGDQLTWQSKYETSWPVGQIDVTNIAALDIGQSPCRR